MKEFIETKHLILREFVESDVESLFDLDSNIEVHRYLGNNPLQTIHQASEIIENLRLQYLENSIGRWATIEKATGDFIGWSGLKLVKENWNNHTNYFDIGYRLHPKYWGKGYATESSIVALEYGFVNLKALEIIGSASVENKASRRVLEKCGLKFIENFYWKNIQCDWLSITYDEWIKRFDK